MKYLVVDLETYEEKEFRSYAKASEYADGLVSFIFYELKNGCLKEIARSD